MTFDASTIEVRTQRTPNPNAMKFVVSKPVKTDGKISYTEIEACRHVPLASVLLGLANVTQVHFFDNVITVTQNGASDWAALSASVIDRIETEAPLHDPNFVDSLTKAPVPRTASADPEINRIEEILDRTVRPGLQADGGDLEVLELDGNILSIKYQGACGGCPSSMMGTLQAIEGILRSEFNPYLEVVAV
jgi:Fe-S cluster biogenesis protein NfuA